MAAAAAVTILLPLLGRVAFGPAALWPPFVSEGDLIGGEISFSSLLPYHYTIDKMSFGCFWKVTYVQKI